MKIEKKKILNISLFVIAAVIITIVMPSGGVFKYKFQYGQNWSSSPIIAQFDFPLLKTQSEYSEDINKYEKSYIPIYKIDTLLSAKALNLAVNYFTDTDTSKNSAKNTAHKTINSALKQIYETGIINDNEDYLNNDNTIRLIKGNSIRVISIENIYTPNDAKRYIISKLIAAEIPENEYLSYPLSNFISPNLIYDIAINDNVKSAEKSNISKTKGFISKGSIVLNKGETIDQTALNKLNSFQKEFTQRGGVMRSYYSIFALFFYISLLMVLSYFSLKNFRADIMESTKNVMFLVILYVLTACITAFITQKTSINIYAIPFVIVPFYIAAFYSSKMSVHQYIYVLLIASLMAPAPFEFIVINFLSGIVGILIIKHSYRRRTIMLAVAATLITYIVVYCIISIIGSGNVSSIEIRMFMWFLINAATLYLLYQLLFIIEKVFNFVTRITLFELCDTSGGLLAEMATMAPGTFQHSLQVANLAQDAAKSIEANDLLAKTGALYHDIGKIANPMYFIENNTSLDSKHHDKLSPKESAKIIKAHVTDGLILAKKHKLPEVVIEFINSHHGDSLIYFFYKKALNSFHESLDIEDFRYPGPRPMSKESAICMMADSIEAASRSLEDYSEERISTMIDTIIGTQISESQYSESALRFRDIEKIKASFKRSLMNIYHSRIAYPER